jgi:hypothetical protein
MKIFFIIKGIKFVNLETVNDLNGLTAEAVVKLKNIFL